MTKGFNASPVCSAAVPEAIKAASLAMTDSMNCSGTIVN